MTTTTQDTSVHLNVASRYKDTKIILRRPQNVRELGLWSSDLSFSRAGDFALHQVIAYDVGRLDLLSYRYYGTVDYWWIIADANDMVCPLRDMIVGDYIKIPPRTLIESFLRRAPVRA